MRTLELYPDNSAASIYRGKLRSPNNPSRDLPPNKIAIYINGRLVPLSRLCEMYRKALAMGKITQF